ANNVLNLSSSRTEKPMDTVPTAMAPTNPTALMPDLGSVTKTNHAPATNTRIANIAKTANIAAAGATGIAIESAATATKSATVPCPGAKSPPKRRSSDVLLTHGASSAQSNARLTQSC